jgi:broad specificity phosphatase PhoE
MIASGSRPGAASAAGARPRVATERPPTTRRAASLARARPAPRRPRAAVAAADDDDPAAAAYPPYSAAADPFLALADRADAPSLPLPLLPPGAARRVVLVRHGESTWNAAGRVQGSSDFSELTEKGARQAAAAAAALAPRRFAAAFTSPLHRAGATAAAVAAAAAACPAPAPLPSLREIDLYSFQGLDKAARTAPEYAAAYAAWQNKPEAFELDGRAPVRELWHRASRAWREVLAGGGAAAAAAPLSLDGDVLVVAHNAVNQALLCAALGLPPAAFRRLAQANAGFSVVDLEWPAGGGPPRVRIERLNQTSAAPVRAAKLAAAGAGVLVLVAGAGYDAPAPAATAALAAAGLGAAPTLRARGAAEVLAAAAGVADSGGALVAFAPPAACQAVLGAVLGDAAAGAALAMGEGRLAAVTFAAGCGGLAGGVVACANFDPAFVVTD